MHNMIKKVSIISIVILLFVSVSTIRVYANDEESNVLNDSFVEEYQKDKEDILADDTDEVLLIEGSDKELIYDSIELSVSSDVGGLREINKNIASGVYGTCTWVINNDGLLTISPTNGVSGTLPEWSILPQGWYEYRNDVTSVIIEKGVKAFTCRGMFHSHANCLSIDLSGLDTSEVTDFSLMFDGCSSLASINIANLITDNATDMKQMFQDCSSLSSIDLSSFNTSNVQDMAHMFAGCSSLSSLDVTGFDTRSVTNMGEMFWDCNKLSVIDVTGFDTGNVKWMAGMFRDCSLLQSVDVSRFDTNNAEYMGVMFAGCSSLQSLDVSNFDTGNVVDMSGMFRGCSLLQSIDVTGFDTGNVKWMAGMFRDCSLLQSVDVSNFDTSTVEDMSLMFYSCSSLKTLDLSNFDTANVIDSKECNIITGDTDLLWLKLSKNFYANPNLKPIFPRDLYYTTDDSLKTSGSTVPYDINSDAVYAVRYRINYDGLTDDDSTYIYYYGQEDPVSKKLNDGSGYEPRRGKYFIGWDTDSSAKTVVYEANEEVNFDDLNNDLSEFDSTSEITITLYPVFGYKYTLSYDPNGGTGAPEAQSIADTLIDKTFNISNTEPQKDNAHFLGWAESPDATEAAYQPGEEIVLSSDKTLYAVWKKGAEPSTPVAPYVIPKTGVDSVSYPTYMSYLPIAAIICALYLLRKSYKYSR